MSDTEVELCLNLKGTSFIVPHLLCKVVIFRRILGIESILGVVLCKEKKEKSIYCRILLLCEIKGIDECPKCQVCNGLNDMR